MAMAAPGRVRMSLSGTWMRLTAPRSTFGFPEDANYDLAIHTSLPEQARASREATLRALGGEPHEIRGSRVTGLWVRCNCAAQQEMWVLVFYLTDPATSTLVLAGARLAWDALWTPGTPVLVSSPTLFRAHESVEEWEQRVISSAPGCDAFAQRFEYDGAVSTWRMVASEFDDLVGWVVRNTPPLSAAEEHAAMADFLQTDEEPGSNTIGGIALDPGDLTGELAATDRAL